jgi:ABC-type dipeptide/oligopeptide/nickel transport system ATPase component/ABC-type dipeptide/oligopeptide/nickel transport system permease subunit
VSAGASRSLNAAAARRLAASRTVRLCGGAVLLLAILAAAAPFLPLRAPDEPDAGSSFAPPGAAALWENGGIGSVLGCDALGRCLLSRTLHGLGVSLLAAGAAAVVSLAIGVFFGVLAGYRGGRTDLFVMRMVDVLDSVPLVFIVIFVQSFLRGMRGGDQAPGGQIWIFFATLGAVTWLTMARLVRAQALSVRERSFVEAARALGASDAWIIRRHVLPNLLPTILVALTLTIPRILLFESFLSFLGLGVEAPQVSLGVLARSGIDSVSAVLVRPWLIAVPAAVLGLLLFCVNLLGDAVRDAFDPKAAAAPGGEPASTATEPAAIEAPPPPRDALLAVRGLRVDFATPDGRFPAVRGASFWVRPGETLAIVGESGSGKSAALHGLLGLLPTSATTTAAEARFAGADLLDAGVRRRVLGARIALVPQDPIGALAPHLRAGSQVVEAVRAHRRIAPSAARARTLEVFRELRIPDPERVFEAYPHELSGGLAQRVLIAMALVVEPDLILADEPTTALDVTVQLEILKLLRRVLSARRCALVIVSHDLGVVAGLADRIVVMDKGTIVESADAERVLGRPESARARAILLARQELEAGASA